MRGESSDKRTELTAFSLYLRTGLRVEPESVEVKFNPWHNERDGRFTFTGQGRYFGRGDPGGSFGGGGGAGGGWPAPRQARRDEGVPDRRRNSPRHSDNYAIHIVRPGDSLTRIATLRKGLTARDLAWLNQQPVDQPLKIGQRIKLPHQAYLDAGRAAKNKAMALAHYMGTHGGKLPPDTAHPPSLESQVLNSNWKRETRNGYDFHVDAIARPREIIADLRNGPVAIRSRRAQAGAGKPDRRPGDDGGHFIAARFNGPGDRLNHFAQDASFNRGAYRAMEDRWARDLRAGRKVVVDIVPLYEGTSRRPYHVNVRWTVDGKQEIRSFPNEHKGGARGRR